MFPVVPQVEQRVGNHGFAIETLQKADKETLRGNVPLARLRGIKHRQRQQIMSFSEELVGSGRWHMKSLTW